MRPYLVRVRLRARLERVRARVRFLSAVAVLAVGGWLALGVGGVVCCCGVLRCGVLAVWVYTFFPSLSRWWAVWRHTSFSRFAALAVVCAVRVLYRCVCRVLCAYLFSVVCAFF